jgi:hypothetical protein
MVRITGQCRPDRDTIGGSSADRDYRSDIGDALALLDLDAHSLDVALCNASALSERWLATPPIEMRSLVRDRQRRSLAIVRASQSGLARHSFVLSDKQINPAKMIYVVAFGLRCERKQPC